MPSRNSKQSQAYVQGQAWLLPRNHPSETAPCTNNAQHELTHVSGAGEEEGRRRLGTVQAG